MARNKRTGRLGKFIDLPLRKALEKQPGLEARRRIERLLEKLQDAAPAPEVVRSLRSVEVLELIGTADAREAIQRLYATGRYQDIVVEATPRNGGVQVRISTRNSCWPRKT